MKTLITSFLLILLSSAAFAHSGPAQEWCDEIGGQTVCVPASEWYGRWQICFQDAGEDDCVDGYSYVPEAYEPWCLAEIEDQLEGNMAVRFESGVTHVSHEVECTEDPVAAGWPDDPRDPCVHPANWFHLEEECRPEIDEWVLTLDATPDPDPDPDPTPDPTPDPDPDPAPGLVISDIGAANVTSTCAHIIFSMDPPATGQTNWGLTDAVENIHGPETRFLAFHRQQISGCNLQPNTQYFYKVSGCTADGMCAESEVKSFTTTP